VRLHALHARGIDNCSHGGHCLSTFSRDYSPMKNESRLASVDGDAAISELIRLGLAEMVWTATGAGYRLVQEFKEPNAALRSLMRPKKS